jgi:hypothetical protein
MEAGRAARDAPAARRRYARANRTPLGLAGSLPSSIDSDIDSDIDNGIDNGIENGIAIVIDFANDLNWRHRG